MSASGPAFPPGFIEPTRRLPFGARFDYSGRYGASLVLVVLGSYILLNVASNASQISLAISGRGQDALVTFYLVTQLLFALATVVTGFLIAPATLPRRLIAAGSSVVIYVLWFAVFSARLTGPTPFGREFSTLLLIVTSIAYVVPLIAALGWLIVRERPILSYLLLLLTPLGGIIQYVLILNGAPSIASLIAGNITALAVGVGIAWAARGLATLFSPAPVAAAPLAPPAV